MKAFFEIIAGVSLSMCVLGFLIGANVNSTFGLGMMSIGAILCGLFIYLSTIQKH